MKKLMATFVGLMAMFMVYGLLAGAVIASWDGFPAPWKDAAFFATAVLSLVLAAAFTVAVDKKVHAVC